MAITSYIGELDHLSKFVISAVLSVTVSARQEAQPGSTMWLRADLKVEKIQIRLNVQERGLFVEIAHEANTLKRIAVHNCNEIENQGRGSDISQIPFPAF